MNISFVITKTVGKQKKSNYFYPVCKDGYVVCECRKDYIGEKKAQHKKVARILYFP